MQQQQQQQQQEESAVLFWITHGQQTLYDFFVDIGWEKQKKDRLGVFNMQHFFTPVCFVIGQIWIPNARTTIEIDKKII